MKTRTKALILFSLTVLSFSIDPLFARKIAHYDPLFLTFATALIGSLLVFPFIVPLRKKIIHLGVKDWFWLVLIGLFSQVVAFILFFQGIKTGTATESAFLNGMSTVFAIGVAHLLLHERMSKKQYIGCFVMFVGLYIFTTLFSLEISSASLYFIGAAFFWGSMQVAAKYITPRVPMLVISFFRLFVGAILLIPFVYTSFDDVFLIPSIDLLFIFLFAFAFTFGLVCFYWVINYLKASEASLFALPVPLLTAFLGYIFLGEVLVPLQWVGGLLLIGGMYWVLPRN